MAQQSSITTFFSTPCIRHISEVDGLEAVGEEHDETDLQPKTKFQRVCPSQTEEGAMTSNADTQSEDRLGENTTGALGNHALDIGLIIRSGMSAKEVSTAVTALSRGEKYRLLFKHISPPNVLPGTLSYGCKRKFNSDWLNKYPWLVYSPANDGVYCAPCALLCSEQNRTDKGFLVNVPFRNWVKLSDTLATHAKHKYHAHSMQEADTLRAVVDNPGARLDVKVNTALQDRLATNKQILQEIERATLYLTKQGLPLRGHREEFSSSNNPGNFLALLKDRAITDAVLKKHLEQPSARNCTYLSPRSQNDVIRVIGFDIIRASIITEVKKAKFFAVLADEILVIMWNT